MRWLVFLPLFLAALTIAGCDSADGEESTGSAERLVDRGFEAVFSEDAETIFYLDEEASPTGERANVLYAIDATGGSPRELLRAEFIQEIIPGPSGTLAVGTAANGPASLPIFIVDAESGESRRLTEGTPYLFTDPSTLLITRRELVASNAVGSHLYQVDARTGEATLLLPGFSVFPITIESGRLLFSGTDYSDGEGDTSGLYALPLGGGEPEALSVGPNVAGLGRRASVRDAADKPDGCCFLVSEPVFRSPDDRDEYVLELAERRLDGSDVTILTDTGEDHVPIGYLPDGRLIFEIEEPGRDAHVPYVSEADGSDRRRLAPGDGRGWVTDIADDGRSVLLVGGEQNSGLYRVDLDG